MLTDERMLAISTEVAHWFELSGIVVIIVGSLLAFVQFFLTFFHLGTLLPSTESRPPVPAFRRMLGRSILTGLELLVAADIIQTVAVEPTLHNVTVLGIIVLIRTFLSFSLEVEIDGRWPWQAKREE